MSRGAERLFSDLPRHDESDVRERQEIALYALTSGT